MGRHHLYKYITDRMGDVVASATVSVLQANSSNSATIYTAESGGDTLNATPQLTSNAEGFFEFWVDDSDYNKDKEFKIEVKHSNITDTTIDYIGIPRSTGCWKVRNANFTAISGDKILADTSVTSFSILLPITPSSGNEVFIKDGAGNFDASPVYVNRNGENIRGAEATVTLNASWSETRFVYLNATTGWAY